MLSDDLRDLEEALKQMSVREISEHVDFNADCLMEDIEDRFGKFNEFDVTIAQLRVCLKALLKATRVQIPANGDNDEHHP
ncbi:MAG: hypothetical protein WCC21_12595 [Candidatus Acidiferrales bacterium]